MKVYTTMEKMTTSYLVYIMVTSKMVCRTRIGINTSSESNTSHFLNYIYKCTRSSNKLSFTKIHKVKFKQDFSRLFFFNPRVFKALDYD